MNTQTPTTLRAEDQFDRLASERIQEIRESIRKSSELEQAVNGFEKLMWIKANEGSSAGLPGLSRHNERFISKGAAPNSISPEDLQRFITFGKAYEHLNDFDSLLGIYATVLMERCPTDKISLILPSLKNPINDLGFYLHGKEVEIKGNLGNCIGSEMREARLIVRGNTGHSLGNQMQCGHIEVFGNTGDGPGYKMSGGVIDVHGNAGDHAGTEMRFGLLNIKGRAGHSTAYLNQGGIIEVHGRVGKNTGYRMQGGRLTLHGAIGDLSDEIPGGEVYHKDRLIVSGGKLVS